MMHTPELTIALLNNQVDNIRCLNELRNMGFSIALDDFGTDCAALSYLQRIPVSTIKVDRSLINDLPNHKEHNKFIKATIAMAHELDIKVVAEGVETAAQTKFLALIGCDRAQGFHFGSPVRIEELIARLSGGKVLPLHKNQHSSL
jgi:EAL domain-containing protein (putative c-di-GMP-specific phosphodiesterase class I)